MTERYFPVYGYGVQPPRRQNIVLGRGARFSSSGQMSPKAAVPLWPDTWHRTAVWLGVAKPGPSVLHDTLDYPFVSLQSAALETHRVGLICAGDEDPTTGWWSLFNINGAAQRLKENTSIDYRNTISSAQFDDHPTQPGLGYQSIGVWDHTDADGLVANAATFYTKDDSGPGYHSHYGLNYYWYSNPVYGVAPTLQMAYYGAPTDRFDVVGDAWVHGTLSKGSGSFDIEHPTVQGKRLRHSFIEGPQADLIYRGTAELGVAPMVIDMDTEFDMTPGTWEALNCTPWSIVSASGKVVEWEFEGSTLTITGDEGTTCMWMVIGERHDPHMKDDMCTMADSEGRVVVEYDEPEPPIVPEHITTPNHP